MTTILISLTLSSIEALVMFAAADCTSYQYNIIRTSYKDKCLAIYLFRELNVFPKYCITKNKAEVELNFFLDYATQTSSWNRIEKFSTSLQMGIWRLQKTNVQTKFWKIFWQWLKHFPKAFSSFEIYKHHKLVLKCMAAWFYAFISTFLQPHTNKIHSRGQWHNPTVSKMHLKSGTELKNTDTPDLLFIASLVQISMVDGKFYNASNATSIVFMMKYYTYKKSSTDFNKWSIGKGIVPNPLNFGQFLSIFHARIKFFESILHLTYNIQIK